MVEPYPFEKGESLGGRVLWREPAGSLERRKKLPSEVITLPLAITVPITGLALWTATRIPQANNVRTLMIIASLGVIAALLMMYRLFLYFTKGRAGLTPFMIYSNGISISVRERPFYLFKDVSSIDEISNGSKKGPAHPRTEVMLADGILITFGVEAFSDSEQYRDFQKTLMQAYADFRGRESAGSRSPMK